MSGTIVNAEMVFWSYTEIIHSPSTYVLGMQLDG